MKAQEVKRQIRLREWAAQIEDCRQSGLTVNQWCAENGIHKKTYYNRMKRVREELLETMETGKSLQLPGQNTCVGRQIAKRSEMPAFVTLPVASSGVGSAVTVRIGGYAVDIRNGADSTVVEQVLQAVSRL